MSLAAACAANWAGGRGAGGAGQPAHWLGAPPASMRPAAPARPAGQAPWAALTAAGRAMRGCAGSAARRRPPPPLPPLTALHHAPHCSGMSNEDIDAAVQQAKKDMFSARIKFAKREVRRHVR